MTALGLQMRNEWDQAADDQLIIRNLAELIGFWFALQQDPTPTTTRSCEKVHGLKEGWIGFGVACTANPLAVVGFVCNCNFHRMQKQKIEAVRFSINTIYHFTFYNWIDADTSAFSANTFSLNVFSTFTAIYSQSIVNTNNFFTYFYQKKQIPQKCGFIWIKPIVWE